MPNFDPRMVESELGVLFSLPSGVIDRVQRVGLRRIVLSTQYSPVHAFLAVLCTVLIDWSHSDAAGWYPYYFPTVNVFPVRACCTKQRRTCLVLEPRTQVVALNTNMEDRMTAVMERMKRETD